MPDLVPLPPNVTLQPLTPREALAFFRGKIDTAITFHADQLWQSEHNTARTVSRLTDADLIDAIYTQLDAAIAEGLSVRDFTKALRPALEKAGWWGTTEVLNPDTGELLKTTFDASRLRLIYDVNVRQAHAAGRWARIERNQATHPYILYRTMGDERVRLSHRRWDHVCLPVNDGWWDTYFPPNDWRCRCRAYAISQREYDKLLAAGQIKPKPPKEGTILYLNKSTGQVMEVPAGIGPGWAYNPGKSAARAQALLAGETPKLERQAPALARATLAEVVASPQFAEWLASPVGAVPVALVAEAQAARLNAQATVVQISEDTATKQAQAHPEIAPADYAWAQAAIDRGEEIVDRKGSTPALIFVLEEAGWVTVVKATKSGKALFLTGLRRLSSDAGKRDRELLRLREKGNG